MPDGFKTSRPQIARSIVNAFRRELFFDPSFGSRRPYAVKIARHYTGRQAVVAFDHAYHGRTNLTMALTAKNMPYKQGFGPFAGEIYRVPMAYPLRWPGGQEACKAEALPEDHAFCGMCGHKLKDATA